MKVKKTDIPKDSLVADYLSVTDYKDAFELEITYEHAISPDDIMVNFWTDFPWWVTALFKFRNFFVKFVGLEGSEFQNAEDFEQCIRSGGEYRFISFPAKRDNETVMLLRDKHLNAYISVYIENVQKNKKIFACTLVHFNEKLGRIYFCIIKPFHELVVKSVLKRAVRKAINGIK